MFASRFIDETFDIHNGQQYILSIQCALDGFSFSVYDLIMKKFVVFVNHQTSAATPFELRNYLETFVEEEPILQQTYKQVKISYLTRETTLIPEALFLPEETVQIFQMTFAPNRSDELLVEHIAKKWVIISAIPRMLKEWFTQKFGSCTFYAPFTPLFYYGAQQKYTNDHVLIFLHGHSLFVLSFIKTEPVLMNTYYVKDDADCLFYLLNVLKQQSETKPNLVLMGNIKPGSSLENQLKSHFGKVQFAQAGKHYTLSYTFHQEPVYYHLPTLELALCE